MPKNSDFKKKGFKPKNKRDDSDDSSVDEKGNIITRLISVNVPVELSPGAVNECFTCGRVTVVGIYVPLNDIDEYEDPGNQGDYDQSS